MRAYFLYLRDERYHAPTLEVVTAADDPAITEFVRRRLDSSPHYLGAEVWDGDRLVVRLDDGPDMDPPARAAQRCGPA